MKKKFLSYILLLSVFVLAASCDKDENNAYPYGGHDFVDLGLPSGLKWATMNVGASVMIQAGNFYAWGETETKQMYNFVDYKYCSETNADSTLKTLSKYVIECESGSWGNIDNITQLDDGDDVARQLWGDGWRMPTWADMNELLEICNHANETVNGVSGTRFIGPNGNSIFLPWAGTMYNGELEYPARAYYWTSTLNADDCRYGEGLFLSAKFCMRGNGFFRCSGRLVRPVHD